MSLPRPCRRKIRASRATGRARVRRSRDVMRLPERGSDLHRARVPAPRNLPSCLQSAGRNMVELQLAMGDVAGVGVRAMRPLSIGQVTVIVISLYCAATV